MPINSKNIFENIILKTRIYLLIILVLLVVICILNSKLIIPAIIVYVAVIIYAYLTNNKKKNELTAHIKDLTLTVDSAAKSTLINSPFPLVIINLTGNVIWKSVKFNNEFANIDIKNYISDIAKEIQQKINIDPKQNRIETKLAIQDKTYKIIGEYAKEKQKKKEEEYIATLYFIDETENIKIEKRYEDSKLCIGIIMIDNYEDVMQRIPTEEKPQLMATIEKSIYDWVTNTQGLILKSERDTYIYIFEQRYLDELQENKFSILDTIKEINSSNKVQVTLSIGISGEGNTNYEKYKSALSTIDLALGRGGDQAVVRTDGKYNFFGGRTQELEKRTKVKARIVAHALEDLINSAKNVIIMGHTNGDIDSLGSSLALSKLVKSLDKEVHVVNQSYGLTLSNYIETINEQKEYAEMIINEAEAMEIITTDTLLIIVDTNKRNYVEAPKLLDKTAKIVVIDHHRKSTDFIEDPILSFHEVYASSTAELVTEILQYATKPIELSEIEVQSLYGGIMIDTKNFTFKTGVRTFEAAAYLRKCGADIIKVKKWFQSDLKSYNIIAEIVRKAEIINSTIGISIYDKEDENAGLICAKAADEMLTISDITASFVIGNMGNKVCISARSIGDINVQIILEKLRRRRTYNISRRTNRREINRRS